MDSWCKPLFEVIPSGHLSTYLLVRPFGLRNHQKAPKECPHTFPTQQKLRQQQSLKNISQWIVRYKPSYSLRYIRWKVCWHLFRYLLMVLKLGITLKRGVHLLYHHQLSFMTLESDANIEEELTCQFKIDMRNLTNFDAST